jgi:hypothetical protein
MNMKGTPSNRMLKNEIEKSCKLNVNQLITQQISDLEGGSLFKPRAATANRMAILSLSAFNHSQVSPPTSSVC